MDKFQDTLEYARKLDGEDPLKVYKDRFYTREGDIYLDGNSLGLCSKDAEKYLFKALDDWKKFGIDIWTHPEANYFLYQDKLGGLFAPLINADPDEVTICTNTTINIHKAISTFYHPTKKRHKILMDELSFPTDLYACASQIKLKGLKPEDSLVLVKSKDGKTISEDDIIEEMKEDVSIVLLPSVLYRSAQLIDMKKVAKAARERGIIIGFDLCHSIGAIYHDFKEIEPDFAVFCTYKYMNGGPGAIAGLYINRKHFKLEPGMTGWHGNKKETQFDMNIQYESAEYAGAWQSGTQPIFSMAPLEGSLRMFEEAGIKNIRKKSLKITEYLMYLIDNKLKGYGFTIGNPREDEIRGGHVALEHKEAYKICQSLKENNVIPDFRHPNVIRLAPVAFYTSYEDIYKFVEILEKIMKNEEYKEVGDKRGLVL